MDIYAEVLDVIMKENLHHNQISMRTIRASKDQIISDIMRHTMLYYIQLPVSMRHMIEFSSIAI
jgi:hypothetical protein